MNYFYSKFLTIGLCNLFIALLVTNALANFDPRVSIFVFLLFSLFIQIPFIVNVENKFRVTVVILALSFSLFYSMVCIYQFDIMPGLDATRYYDFLLSYNSISDILRDGIFRVSENQDNGVLSGPGSYFIFGIPVHYFYLLMPSKNVYYIVILNNICKMLLIFTLKEIFSTLHSEKYSFFIVVLIAVSPTITYFSSVMGKDIFIMMLCFLLCITIIKFLSCNSLRLKIGLFTVIMALFSYCILLRPYSPFVAILYSLYFTDFKKYIKLSLLTTAVIILYFTLKDFAVIVNWPLIAGFMYLAPNPIQITNYSSFTLIPVLCTVGIALYLLVKFINTKSIVFDSLLVNSFIVVFIFSAIMTLVGFYSIDNQEGTYELGRAGDAMFRKQLLIIPMVMLSLMLLMRKNLNED
ncbi:hypothetical protein [Buttiauxella izardii]|uniref:Uncharacterized protein n=1 Tax=Buttiauxella izardii TaxID=82991 RepID=A0A3A5K5V7_9ENTR|nr:hypothetical protein [Buttiauxella izardii]RJT25972.1 hypothetical protein D6029_07030 [Buttiauxella izardii]